MDQITQVYEQLIERFNQWASAESEIRAALVIGSRARVDHPADEWADLDVVVITKDPKRLISSVDWLTNIGVPILTFIESTPTGSDKEHRVLFEGGVDVDFAVMPYEKVKKLLKAELTPQLALELANTLGRGMRVLLDKEGLVDEVQRFMTGIKSFSSQPPTPQDFLQAVNDFWYHVVWTAKHLRRGELWWAKSGCDGRLKSLLAQMLAWHAQATKGAQHDTWFRGRFLEQWADSQAIAELREVFAHYDQVDVWRALFATMALFRWLAVETAARWEYSYPTYGDKVATELTTRLSAGKD